MLLLMFGYVHVMYFRLPSHVLPSSFCLAIGQHVCQRDRALFDWQAAKEFLNRGSAKRNVVCLACSQGKLLLETFKVLEI